MLVLFKQARRSRIAAAVGGLTMLLAGCGQQQAPPEASDSAPAPQADALEMAFNSIGGRDDLANLDGFSIEGERDTYLMGQGPEPGSGIMTSPLPIKTTAAHDLARQRLRLDVVSMFPARAGGYQRRESTTLIVGNAGYLSEDDLFGIVPERDRPLSPDKTAAALRTERLLNPHILLKEALSNPSLASSVSSATADSAAISGHRYTADEIFPVTLDRVRQTGKRTLVGRQEWLDSVQGTPFFDLMAKSVEIDPEWLDRWQDAVKVDEASLQPLVLEDDVFPITLLMDPASGRLDKLQTMGWDVVYGDVPLEVTYHDWQAVDGVTFPMLVRLSYGGAPGLEVRRSVVNLNPDYDASRFAPPEGVTYVHDAEAAKRGKTVSQTMRAFTIAGAARPAIATVDLEPGVHLLYAAPVDGVYTLVAEQENGVVVMEPGQNDLKGEQIIEWIGEKYPGKAVTHLIVSHHHNDHGAGIRPYVAAGATLVVGESAVDFYRAQIDRPKSTVLVDALDRNPVAGKVDGVALGDSYRIEDATQPIVVYPVLGGHVRDMVVAVLEKQKMLYAGDLYVSGVARDLRAGTVRGPGVVPFHSAVALDKTIRANDLDVPVLVGSHDRQPVSYADLQAYIED